MTSGGFQADTSLVALTSQKAANSADTIIGFFRKMDSDTSQVLPICKGPMFGAVGEALTNLQTERDKLIPTLQKISEQLKQSGQGMNSQAQDGATAVRSQVQSGLSTPLNHR